MHGCIPFRYLATLMDWILVSTQPSFCETSRHNGSRIRSKGVMARVGPSRTITARRFCYLGRACNILSSTCLGYQLLQSREHNIILPTLGHRSRLYPSLAGPSSRHRP